MAPIDKDCLVTVYENDVLLGAKMRNRKLIKISKFLSFLLRHGANDFDLSPDQFGFVQIEDVLRILRSRYGYFRLEDLEYIVETDVKQRYEIVLDRIRARYGHSIEVSSRVAAVEPPEYLYHGTAARNIPLILRDGLRPMRRRFVHLSLNRADAVEVGKRHSRQASIVRVHARRASESGVEFFRESDIFIAYAIPTEFLEVVEYSV